MEEEMFDELVQSIKEAGQIRRIRMNQKLAEKLQELEEEYDVELMTVEDVQEFLKSDMEFMEKAFDKEIEYGKSSKDYVAGLNQGLFIAKQWYEIRLDEGF